MPFSDNFTGTDNQTLATRSGWTLLRGSSDDAKIGTNRLIRTVSTGGILFYGTGDDSSTSQTVGADILVATNANIVVYGSGGATFSGYRLRAQTGLTSLRLFRVNADVDSATLMTTSAVADCTGITMTVSLSGGNPVITVFRQGVQIGTFTDTSGSKITSGQRGVWFPATTANPALDNYSDNYSAVSIRFTINEKSSGFVWGGMGVNSIPFSGTYTGTAPSGIKARLTAAGVAVSGFDWQTVVASPAGNAWAFSFANVPVGGPYRMDIRFGDDAATEVLGANDFYSGACVWLWGQSQADKLHSTGGGTVTPTSGVKASILRASNELDISAASATLTSITSSASSGSGIIPLVNQWHADTGGAPIMLVDINIPGSAIGEWNANTIGGSPVTTSLLWGDNTTASSGFATFMAVAAGRQADAVVFYQGTSDVGSEGTYAAAMDTLLTKFDAIIDTPFVMAVMPHPRSNDDNGLTTNKTWALRNVQYLKSISGGLWRLLCWNLDHQAVLDGDPHQATGTAGNIRIGTRMGRGLAGLLHSSAPSRLGPQIVSAVWVDPLVKTAFDLTFSANIETPSGATTGLPQFYVTTNDWATTTGHPGTYGTGHTAAIVASNKVRITKTTGNWVGATVKVDYLRSVPWDTEAGANGGEAAIGTLLDTLIYGTDSFDSGRGLPASPVMGSGMAVSEGSSGPVRKSGLHIRIGIGL